MEREQPSRFLRVEVKLDQTLQYLIRQATRKLAARVHSSSLAAEQNGRA